MTKVAVVILNYNGSKLLREFLPSVVRNSYGAEIIIADNNSTDDSVQYLTQEFPQLRIIRIAKNLGFCGGYNYALAQVNAEYFVLLNSDVEVTEHWLDPVVALMDGDVSIGAVQPKILSYRDKTMFEYAGAGGGFIDYLGYPFCRGRIFDSLEKDDGQFDDTSKVFWATGACMFVRADLYKKLGGLDEDFFAHMEEIDFCWRLNRAGYSVYYQGKSKVYHLGGGTLAANNPRKTYFNFRNGLGLIIKNLSGGELALRLPVRVGLDWIAALRFLAGGQAQNMMAIVRAHFYILFNFFNILTKRKKVQSLNSFYDTRQVYTRSIVVDFYIRKRKFFRDLIWINNPK